MPEDVSIGCAKDPTVRVIVLAGGRGRRMLSDTPKVLHTVGGKPILSHVIEKAIQISNASPIIIYGDDLLDEKNKTTFGLLEWVYQDKPLGTGHAVSKALPYISDSDTVLIMYADIPLITTTTLKKILERQGTSQKLTVLTADIKVPDGYGRIIREGNKITEIIESVDLKTGQELLKECNTGFMAISGSLLKSYIPLINNSNKQKEYYLTDCVSIAIENGREVDSIKLESEDQIVGINDMSQLAKAERIYQNERIEQLMKSGVRILDPMRVDIRGSLKVGTGSVIDCNVIIEGDVFLGDNVYVGPNSVISNSHISNNVKIEPNCIIDNAIIGDSCHIGPFARIRPSTILDDNVSVGNFVEIKNSKIGSHSKANHLSYLGDANIGINVNVGAGTITCNYDGVAKHKTIIEDNVFIGSNTELVAPLKIDTGSTVAAGSTITKDVAPNSLAISRNEQKQINRWRRSKK